MGATLALRLERSLLSSQLSSTKRSRLISWGFPANAEVDEYGEFPFAGGFSGSTCQSPCFALARKSMNSYAAGPKSPMPPREGSEMGCSRIPVKRGKVVESGDRVIEWSDDLEKDKRCRSAREIHASRVIGRSRSLDDRTARSSYSSSLRGRVSASYCL